MFCRYQQPAGGDTSAQIAHPRTGGFPGDGNPGEAVLAPEPGEPSGRAQPGPGCGGRALCLPLQPALPCLAFGDLRAQGAAGALRPLSAALLRGRGGWPRAVPSCQPRPAAACWSEQPPAPERDRAQGTRGEPRPGAPEGREGQSSPRTRGCALRARPRGIDTERRLKTAPEGQREGFYT